MDIKLFNSLTKKKEKLKTIKENKVGIYTCGPTVYNYAHIGNLRTYVFEDILKRVLLYNNYKVKHVMNITDVGHLTSDADSGEDKMEKKARQENLSAKKIAIFYTDAFKKDLNYLNIISPDTWCKATEHIKEQLKLIKKLEKKGFTYETEDGIYFDTSKFPNYGILANLKNQNLEAGKRVDMGGKKNVTDFALWKFSPKDSKRQMQWNSYWKVGFPGWHIECSAMSTKYLGQPFDIHCGGIDHLPIHHTNEIAQSEAGEDKKLANYWLHCEFLNIKGDKMSKSKDNFIRIQTLIDKNINPLAYRYFLLQTHYRKQISFNFKALESASAGLSHLYSSAKQLEKKGDDKKEKEKFLKLVNNDLDIPNTLAYVWQMIKAKKISLSTLLEFDKVLGLKIKESLKEKKMDLSEEVKELVKQRDKARKEKDWKKSDELRDLLVKKGFDVQDTDKGTTVTK